MWISCLVLDSERLVSDTLFGMAFFAELDDQNVEWLCSRGGVGFYRTVVQHVANKNPEVHGPALRLSGNLCYGRDAHVERLISSGLLEELATHLQGYYAKETKEAAWAASNITAGSPK